MTTCKIYIHWQDLDEITKKQFIKILKQEQNKKKLQIFCKNLILLHDKNMIINRNDVKKLYYKNLEFIIYFCSKSCDNLKFKEILNLEEFEEQHKKYRIIKFTI
jgi:hypothetical protein